MAVMNPIPFNSWTDLFSGDEGTLDHAWKLFMEDLVPLVAIAPGGLQDNIIQGGGHWSGAGYGQGNLSSSYTTSVTSPSECLLSCDALTPVQS